MKEKAEDEIKVVIYQSEKEMPPVAMSVANTLYNKTGSWKYVQPIYQNKTPPCNAGCPAGENIEGWLVLVGKGELSEALQLLLSENPFPAVCGRICYHPCEKACNRGKFDQPLSINSLERFLGDYGLKEGAPPPPPTGRKKERIAIIGSGPAGLASAYYLANMGYRVTIFEASDQLGGSLRSRYPRKRLPEEVVEGEIERIVNRGIDVKAGIKVGHDISFESLQRDYQAILVATGDQRSKILKTEGEKAILSGLEFLGGAGVKYGVKLGGEIAIVGEEEVSEREVRSTPRIITDPMGATDEKGVFACGDITFIPRAINHEVGSGKRAAMAIDSYLKGEDIEKKIELIKIGEGESVSMRSYLTGVVKGVNKIVRFEDLNLDYFEEKPRLLKPEMLAKGALVKEEIAIQEAERCFHCGVCNQCDNCYIYCPDLSIRRRKDSKGYWIDYDYCKGCLICVHECPRNAMSYEGVVK